MVNKKVVDGTELRDVTLRIRSSGVEELLNSLCVGGFCNAGRAKVLRLEDRISVEFLMNVGKYETGVKAMAVTFFIPLTEAEALIEPPEPSRSDKDEKADITIGAVSEPKLP